MKLVVDNAPHVFGPWLARILGTEWLPGLGQYVGLLATDPPGPIAACMYEGFNGKSVRMHFAATGRLTRTYIWFCFYYPFTQLQVSKVISPVESDNTKCIRFIKNLGFTLEATLKDASPKGDLLIFTMTKDQCRWLSLEGQKNGKTETAASA